MLWSVKYAWRSLTHNVMKTGLVASGIALGVMLATTLLLSTDVMQQKIARQVVADYGDYNLQFGYRDDGQFLAEQDVDQLLKGTTYSPVLLPYVRATNELTYRGVVEHSLELSSFKVTKGRYPQSGAEVAVTTSYLRKHHLRVGDDVALPFPSYGVKEVAIVGELQAPRSAFLEQTAFFPLRWLQDELHLQGKVNLVQVKADFTKQQVIAAVKQRFADVKVDERAYLQRNYDKFNVMQPILVATGVTAFLIVALLIMGSFYLSVQSRRKQWVLLRVLGGQTRQVVGVILVEALLVGAVGSFIGALGGYALQFALNDVLNRFAETAVDVPIAPFPTLLLTFSAGIIMSVVGAFLPALTTRHVPLVAILHAYMPVTKRRERVQAAIGVLFFTLGVSGMIWGETFAQWGMDVTALGGGFITFALLILSPILIKAFSEWGAKLLLRRLGIEASLSAQNIARYRYKVALPVSILALGITVAIVGSTLTDSMKGKVAQSVRQMMAADMIVTIPMTADVSDVIPLDYKAKVASIAGVKTVAALSLQDVNLVRYNYDKADQKWLRWMKERHRSFDRLTLGGSDLAAYGKVNQLAVDGKRLARIQEGEGAMVAARAKFLGVRLNDEITVQTETKQPVTVKIVAFLPKELPGLRGDILVPERWAATNLAVRGYASLNMAIAAGATVERPLQAMFKEENVEIYDATRILQQQSALLESMFLIVTILVGLIFMISCIGLINAIIAAIFERMNELATMSAIGASKRQLNKMIILEGSLLSLMAGAIGIGSGLLFSRLVLDEGAVTSMPLVGSLFVVTILIGVIAGSIATQSLKMVTVNS